MSDRQKGYTDSLLERIKLSTDDIYGGYTPMD